MTDGSSMSETHHRLICSPAQFAKYLAILDWMKGDAEFGEFGREFAVNEKVRSLTASRFAWNAFRGASDIHGVHVEKEAISAAQRDREVLAMFADKSSAVEVKERVKAGQLF
jgi:hypothetical protein